MHETLRRQTARPMASPKILMMEKALPFLILRKAVALHSFSLGCLPENIPYERGGLICGAGEITVDTS